MRKSELKEFLLRKDEYFQIYFDIALEVQSTRRDRTIKFDETIKTMFNLAKINAEHKAMYSKFISDNFIITPQNKL
jgi:hypothetical protein